MAKAKTKTRRTAGRTVFQWKAGKRFPVRAEVAGAALETIRQRNNGELTPAVVVETAADPDHPLHRCFEWEETEAARKYREYQARVLINSVRVVVEVGETRQPQIAFVSVDVRGGGRSYLPAATVMGDDEYRAASLAEARASLRGWRTRYAHLTELAEVFDAADRVLSRAG